MANTLTISALTENEQPEVVEFMKRISPTSGQICGWDVGRYVDWRWGWNILKAKEQPTWFSDNCVIFREKNEIQALSVSEYGGKDACILVAERDPSLAKDVFDWLITHWAEKRKGLSIEISHCEYWLSSIFESAGFVENKNTGHEWEYDLGLTPERSILPEGYGLETLREGGDSAFAGIAEVVMRAFNTEGSLETAKEVLQIRTKNPMYLPELNVYTRSPEGTITSYCRGTVNPDNGIACIDPVCCHPDFTRKGLAKATVQECFRQLADKGGRLCYIGSAPMPAGSTFLYRSLGPRRYTTASCWSKEC